ncbi:MAG: hypothetical protein HY574_07890 [candidate division NC10 bacterium]|nr:hypothetical protein [candidate division NC10 bacterium]
MSKSKQVPLWLQRLRLVKSELKSVRFPRTAEEGFRQVAALSTASLRILEEDVRSAMPRATEKQVRVAVRGLLARISRAEAQHTNFWQEERARHFGS